MVRTAFLHSSYQKEDAQHPRMHESMKHEFNEILPVLYQILKIICVTEFHNDSYIGELRHLFRHILPLLNILSSRTVYASTCSTYYCLKATFFTDDKSDIATHFSRRSKGRQYMR